MNPERSGRTRPRRLIFWVLVGVGAVAMVGGALTALLTVRTFSTPSMAMAKTIQPGDLLLVDTTTAQVRRGDVIVEQGPATGNLYLTKRIIGLPGDRVACCDSHGRITVNGKPLDETYLYPGDSPSATRFRVTVPAGRMWLLGDHRSASFDSRIAGPLSVRLVGRVFAILRGGHLIFLHTPSTYVADGLAPADARVAPAVVGVSVAIAGLLLLLVLAVSGVVWLALRSRARGRATAAPAGSATLS